MSDLEEHFAGLLRLFGMPEPVRELHYSSACAIITGAKADRSSGRCHLWPMDITNLYPAFVVKRPAYVDGNVPPIGLSNHRSAYAGRFAFVGGSDGKAREGLVKGTNICSPSHMRTLREAILCTSNSDQAWRGQVLLLQMQG